MTNLITVIITAVIVSLFFKLAHKSIALKQDEGNYVLRYSPYIGWSLIALLIAAALFVAFVALVFIPPPMIKSEKDIYALAGFVLLFTLVIAYIYIDSLSVRILVGEKGIRGAFGLRGRRECMWDEIQHIAYFPRTMMYKISVENKSPLKLNAWLIGIEEFQKLYMAKLPEEKWAEAHEAFKQDPKNGG